MKTLFRLSIMIVCSCWIILPVFWYFRYRKLVGISVPALSVLHFSEQYMMKLKIFIYEHRLPNDDFTSFNGDVLECTQYTPFTRMCEYSHRFVFRVSYGQSFRTNHFGIFPFETTQSRCSSQKLENESVKTVSWLSLYLFQLQFSH